MSSASTSDSSSYSVSENRKVATFLATMCQRFRRRLQGHRWAGPMLLSCYHHSPAKNKIRLETDVFFIIYNGTIQ